VATTTSRLARDAAGHDPSAPRHHRSAIGVAGSPRTGRAGVRIHDDRMQLSIEWRSRRIDDVGLTAIPLAHPGGGDAAQDAAGVIGEEALRLSRRMFGAMLRHRGNPVDLDPLDRIDPSWARGSQSSAVHGCPSPPERRRDDFDFRPQESPALRSRSMNASRSATSAPLAMKNGLSRRDPNSRMESHWAKLRQMARMTTP